MRLLIVSLAAVVLSTAGCGGSAGRRPVTAGRTATTPSLSPSASPSARPARVGTVRNGETRFRVRVTSARTVRGFNRDGSRERAKAGQRLVVIMITATNIGRRPSRLDAGNSEPVDLVGADGKIYYPGRSWGRPILIFPGRSLTEPYVFPVPAGVGPASATVTLFGGTGLPSTAGLRMP
jgi:hypothetical protein